jgi:ubiquinone/menaquinone biosynthesis C-methylase UbiE
MNDTLPSSSHREGSFLQYLAERTAHWDSVAGKMEHWSSWGKYYQRRLKEIYCFLIPPNQTILELGCGQGDLLAALNPLRGVGIDLSAGMINRARQRHPELIFLHADVHDLELDEKFDAIILSDAVNDFWDVQTVLQRLQNNVKPSTRILINSYSRLWETPLDLTRALNLAAPNLYQNWLTVDDIRNLLYLTDFEFIRSWPEVLFPLPIPLLAPFFNRFLIRLWPFCHLGLTNFIMARPSPQPVGAAPVLPVSVIIPACNEMGNIQSLFERIPEMGSGSELIFVEGNSTDDTFGAIEKMLSVYSNRKAALYRQPGAGKGDAVRFGFSKAGGEVLMILDADLTVPPEDLPRFYEALASGKGELVNGVRLVYPMEKEAMRFFNLLGNKFFSLVFSWLLGQPVKDTLCGTKVIRKSDYEMIAANRIYFGDFDPFGDFDLLFGAARMNRKIVDVPIRYRERTYGATNIQRWKHGWLLLRMVTFAARRLKFI